MERQNGPSFLFAALASTEVPPTRYHDYNALVAELRRLNAQYPTLTSLYTLSEKSVGGRDIWAMRISTNPNGQRDLLKPMLKYIGNMHGNEVIGRHVGSLLNLAVSFRLFFGNFFLNFGGQATCRLSFFSVF